MLNIGCYMKYRYLLFLFSFISSFVYSATPCAINYAEGVILDARFSYFLPRSKQVRETVGGGIDYGVALHIPVVKGLNLWTAFDYFKESGKIPGTSYSSSLNIMPVTLGLKFAYPFGASGGECVYYRLYLGAGARYYMVNIKNKIPTYSTSVHSDSFGYIVELGSFISLTRHLALDVFTSFSGGTAKGSSKSHPNVKARSFEIGGWNFGGGLGWKF